MEKYMEKALEEAKKAYEKGEIPIGAVIVKNGEIIAKAHNEVEYKNDPTAHAEMLAIQQACKFLNTSKLIDCEMYITCEPCSMCSGAIVWARIKKIYVGTEDFKSGGCGSVFNIVQEKKLNHFVEVEKNIMKNECAYIMKKFFKELRHRGLRYCSKQSRNNDSSISEDNK